MSENELNSELVDPSEINGPLVHVAPGITIGLDARLSIADLADAAVGDEEEDMLLEKEQIEKKLVRVRGQHTKLGEKLLILGQKLAKSKAITPLAKRLAKDLTTFTGTPHVAELSEGTCDTKKQEVRVDMEIWDEAKKARSSYSTRTHGKSEVIKFTTEMKQVVKETVAKAAEVKALDLDLVDVRRRLADVPRRIKRAKRNLVKAMAGGEITNGASVMRALSSAPPRALPAPERK